MVAPKREGESSDRGDRPEPSPGSRTGGGLTERLRDALLGESDEDLVLDRSDAENGIAQWLRALDLQVLGACRADERLKPLLKLNISSGVEEDRLLARLGQHFDASEVGMLARCLCIPLVSIRVGKVKKQGNLLSPTATRGHLNISLLSSSNMRISFTGDDGCTEKLAVLSNVAEASEVVVEEISADTSGRSFLIKLPGSEVLYFWCSEKSNDRGMELLAKMKNLLRRKPSLARLTGICESRLDSFATHIQAYLLGSSNTAKADLLSLSGESSAGVHASDTYFHSPPLVSKSSRCRITAAHTTKGQPSHQGSLSPRPNTFKDGTARSSSSIRNNIKEKLKRRGDTHNSSFLSIIQPSIPVSTSCTQSSHQPEDETVRGSDSCSFLPSVTLSEMHCISSSPSSSIPLFLNLPSSLISSSNSLFSPYYCLCPPCPSALQYPVAPSRLPITFNESMPLPPLSSLLSAAVPPVSLVTSSVPLSIPSLPMINLPSLFSESFARLSIPVTSFVTLPTSQQISTFSGYMSDPIVHTPVIEVCSSGQGYLVSAGPAMSSVMPPLLPSFVHHPLISSTESAVENSARETLRMLMASTPKFTYQKPMIVIPGTDGMNHNATVIPGSNHDVVAAAGQCLYGGAFVDVEAVAMGLSSVGLSLSSSKVDGCVKIGKQERNDHVFKEESSEDRMDRN